MHQPVTEKGVVTGKNTKNGKIGIAFSASRVNGFDPELLYVQCAKCARPVMWTRRRTQEVLRMVGISTHNLDTNCLLLMRGCPHCTKEQNEFRMSVVRMDMLPKDTTLLNKDPLAAHA